MKELMKSALETAAVVGAVIAFVIAPLSFLIALILQAPVPLAIITETMFVLAVCYVVALLVSIAAIYIIDR